jgi:hypothetical protein
MKATLVTTSLTLAALCVLGTACSSSTSGKAAAGGGGSSTVAGASTGGSAAPSGGGGGASCKQLTLADVQPLLIDKVISVKTEAINADGTGQQCEFSAQGTDETSGITVQVLGGSQGATAYAQAVAGDSKPVPVPGVGDKATRDTESGGVDALKGDLFCSVSYSSSDAIPGVGPLEEAHGATNNIGENFYDTIAQAMGTLCNRIYGSGNTTPDLSSLKAADATATPSDGGGLPSSVTLPSDGASS